MAHYDAGEQKPSTPSGFAPTPEEVMGLLDDGFYVQVGFFGSMQSFH